MQIKEFIITKKEILTYGAADSYPIYSFKLEPSDGKNYEFIPGQFVTVFNEDRTVFRSYSIASTPGLGHIELLIEMIDGKLTSYLKGKDEGEVLMIGEPRGNFTIDKENQKLVFLAAGVGIAPFLSMLRSFKSKGEKTDSFLFYSVKHISDIVYHEELKGYEEYGLRIIINVTRDKNPGNGFMEGRINLEEIKKTVNDYKERQYYICGGLGFARFLKQTLMNEGIRPDNIKSDIWGETNEN